MTRNNMQHIDVHIFAQLERLGDESLTPDQIETEAKRSTAIVALADQFIENQKVKLVAAKLFAEHGNAILPMLPQIGNAKPEVEK